MALTAAPAGDTADIERKLSTLHKVSIAHLVVACLGTVLSFDFINSVIAIALSASIISAYNATASSDVRSRARAVLNAGCTHGLAITIFVLGSLSIIAWGSIAFTLGIIFSAVSRALANPNLVTNLTPAEQSRYNTICSGSANACTALSTTFGFLAAYFFLSFILATLNVGLTAGVLCAWNGLSATGAGGSTASMQPGVTVVMMPPAYAMGGPGSPGSGQAVQMVMVPGASGPVPMMIGPGGVPMAMPYSSQPQQQPGPGTYAYPPPGMGGPAPTSYPPAYPPMGGTAIAPAYGDAAGGKTVPM